MTPKGYYTTIASQGGFVVKFAEPPDYRVHEFEGKFDDPGEATREFKKLERFQQHEFLHKTPFEQKVRQAQADLVKLRNWNRGGNH